MKKTGTVTKDAKIISNEIDLDCEIGSKDVENSIDEAVKTWLSWNKNRKHQK